MNTIVMKFGGTSVASNAKLKNIADIVTKEVKKHKIVVVLSAMAGETNKLQSYLDEFGSKNSIESDLVLTSGEQITIGLLTMSAIFLSFSLLATEVPPNFITIIFINI